MHWKYKIIESVFQTPFFRSKKNMDTYLLQVNKVTLPVNNQHLKGMKILFISDLHLDIIPVLTEQLISNIQDIEYDFLFWGGDYFEDAFNLNIPYCNDLFYKILKSVDAEKTYAILGNHDDLNIQKYFESLSIKTLNNEMTTLTYNNQNINCYGLNYFYPSIPKFNNDNFSILLSHTPDHATIASNYNFDLQLSGHTHNGQIQLPKGFVPRKNSKFGKKFLYGMWNHEGLRGYTSSGVGCSTIPVRYNTQSEIVLITLV